MEAKRSGLAVTSPDPDTLVYQPTVREQIRHGLEYCGATPQYVARRVTDLLDAKRQVLNSDGDIVELDDNQASLLAIDKYLKIHDMLDNVDNKVETRQINTQVNILVQQYLRKSNDTNELQ